MLEEMLKKAIDTYVPKDKREAALVTFKGIMASARTEGAMLATADITVALSKMGAK